MMQYLSSLSNHMIIYKLKSQRCHLSTNGRKWAFHACFHYTILSILSMYLGNIDMQVLNEYLWEYFTLHVCTAYCIVGLLLSLYYELFGLNYTINTVKMIVILEYISYKMKWHAYSQIITTTKPTQWPISSMDCNLSIILMTLRLTQCYCM